jgi:hypothetical protein
MQSVSWIDSGQPFGLLTFRKNSIEGAQPILPLANGDLCKKPPFAQSLRQAQILILKILNVFLWLKFSPSLALNKIEHFSKVSIDD